MPTATSPGPQPLDLTDSPLYLIAVLYSARRSKDRVLEGVTRRRLSDLGVRVVFADELPTPPKGARHG